MAPDDRDRTDLERLAVHVPDHVVYRDFAEQTVALNLQTGRYHGLNATAGAMLAALRDAPSVAAAAKRLAPEWDVSEDVLLGDLVELCDGLEQRGLLETRAAE
jgi:coenzyme PQQ synthesis protein D (PqqD)